LYKANKSQVLQTKCETRNVCRIVRKGHGKEAPTCSSLQAVGIEIKCRLPGGKIE